MRLNGQEEAAVSPAAAFAPISSSALPFALWPPPQLTGLSPACGPVEGGTSVLLSGAQLRDTSQPFDELRCRFGAASVRGHLPLTLPLALTLTLTTEGKAYLGFCHIGAA